MDISQIALLAQPFLFCGASLHWGSLHRMAVMQICTNHRVCVNKNIDIF